MIRWIWSRMIKWGWDFSHSYDYPIEDTVKPARIRSRQNRLDVCSDSDGIELNDPINFRVQAVTGGTVVETRWYDSKKDESRTKLHIVTSEENLADAIGKIVTMELLQK